MSVGETDIPKSKWWGWPSDANLMRTIFFGLLIGSATVLYLDFTALDNQDGVDPLQTDRPILPAVDRPEINPNAPQYRPTEQITVQPDILSAPMSATLAPNGIMLLSGHIDPGAAERIKVELDRTKEYIKTVQINSPGGSVSDALEISDKIRDLGFNTLVEDGGYCASSCPIVFAGGVSRVAGKKATIGVHQIYGASGKISAPQAMSDAQTTTAQITKHLVDMGIDPTLWVHALETPPEKLYYFTQAELKKFKLATKLN
ncbi:ATP-dependent Clp protease proteolytic subunit [Maritalea sp.]|uniref:ATP-dependent Clp protease proteolytic subunit n=1 Tax=Maritalea sp. TaxID=2003361 RepID=UPI003EF626F8